MFPLVSAGLALETRRLTDGSTTQLYIDLSLIPYRGYIRLPIPPRYYYTFRCVFVTQPFKCHFMKMEFV